MENPAIPGLPQEVEACDPYRTDSIERRKRGTEFARAYPSPLRFEDLLVQVGEAVRALEDEREKARRLGEQPSGPPEVPVGRAVVRRARGYLESFYSDHETHPVPNRHAPPAVAGQGQPDHDGHPHGHGPRGGGVPGGPEVHRPRDGGWIDQVGEAVAFQRILNTPTMVGVSIRTWGSKMW